MNRMLLPLVALALSGCLNRPHQVTLPDGKSGYTVTRCRKLDKCMAVARQMCGGDYDIKTQSESVHSGFTLLIECKAK